MLKLGLVGLLALSGAVLTGCDEAQSDPRTGPPLVRVTTPIIAAERTQEFTGIVAARVQSDLGFRVGGRVTQRLVNAGETVRQGQPVMRLDDTDLALATRAAAGNLEAARAKALQTIADEKRYRGLIGGGAVSASAYDQAKASADSARGQLAAAQAQAEVARNEKGYGTLLADADGVVVETLAEPGQVVAAGQIVLKVARSGPREALVRLPETLRPALGSIGQARTFDGGTGKATLRQLSDAADPASRTFEARYVLGDEIAGAPLGSTVTVRLVLSAKPTSTQVPVGALLDKGNGPGLWIVSAAADPTVQWQAVTVSGMGEETAIVTSGLKPGQRFVSMGAHMLHDGEAVRIAALARGDAR